MSPRDGSEVIDHPVPPAAALTESATAPESAKPAETDAPQVKPPYPPAADVPTQQGPRGITFDFNLGARVVLPPGEWRVRLRDLDSGNILFESENKGAFVNSSKRFYVRFGIEVWERGERIFTHQYDCTGKEVLVWGTFWRGFRMRRGLARCIIASSSARCRCSSSSSCGMHIR